MDRWSACASLVERVVRIWSTSISACAYPSRRYSYKKTIQVDDTHTELPKEAEHFREGAFSSCGTNERAIEGLGNILHIRLK